MFLRDSRFRWIPLHFRPARPIPLSNRNSIRLAGVNYRRFCIVCFESAKAKDFAPGHLKMEELCSAAEQINAHQQQHSHEHAQSSNLAFCLEFQSAASQSQNARLRTTRLVSSLNKRIKLSCCSERRRRNACWTSSCRSIRRNCQCS